MPSKNIVNFYAPETFYHVYNRGVNRRKIFLDDEDYRTFLNLLKRYLGVERSKDKFGRLYDDLSGEVELLAYCLMPNHFHMFLYQNDEAGMSHLLHRVITSYSRYFNTKYHRIGRLFQDRFKAIDVQDEEYLWHISRYIHLNPIDLGIDWRAYPYSSIAYYSGSAQAHWIRPERILMMFQEAMQPYEDFLKNYEEYRVTLKDVKHALAI